VGFQEENKIKREVFVPGATTGEIFLVPIFMG